MPGGEALFNVAIRTAVVDAQAGTVECGVGSGITFDSAAADEYAEWRTKRLFLERASPDYELLETLRLHRGRYWLRRGHLARLASSAAALGFVCERERIEAILAAAAAARPAGDWRVRLRLAAGGEVGIDVLPLDATPPDATVVLAAAAAAGDNPWLRHKTTRRGLYEALASRQAGIFDTLLHNELPPSS
jgi:para-aminobenzoate synthetase/4-amino-4-deoxychorismate lyase